MSQGIEDGYLPACEVIRREINIDKTGIKRDDLLPLGIRDATTGEVIPADETRDKYEAPSLKRLFSCLIGSKRCAKICLICCLKLAVPTKKR